MNCINTNIDLVQVSLDELGNMYFPTSVSFAGKRVNYIKIFAPYESEFYSPIDGAPVVVYDDLTNFYVSLYNDQKKVLVKDVNARMLSAYYPHQIYINDVLDLDLSRISYIGDLSELVKQKKVILVYVSWEALPLPEEKELPTKAVTVTIPAELCYNKPFKLSQIFDDFFAGSNAKIEAISTDTTYSFYLDLRMDELSFKWMPSPLFREYAGTAKITPFYCRPSTVDFRNSYVIHYRKEKDSPIRITFYYN